MGFTTAALGAFIGYAATSAFFWHFPHLLHKKKNITFSCPHISHRGGSAEGYENTLKSFKNAINKGSNMLELDVRFTKDRQVVVFHDQTLLRVTGQNFQIGDVAYQLLPKLNSEIPIDTIPGENFSDETWTTDERKIPLLREVFEEFPNIPINIDIKDTDVELIHAVSNLITEYDRSDITVWGSFNSDICKQCYKVNPDVCLFFSAKQVFLLLLYAFTGLLPFIPIKETHYEVFLPMAMKRRRLKQVSDLSFTEKCLLWISETFLVWQPLLNHLKKRGIHVYFWVCNDVDEFERCKQLGATGIMTDQPSLLREYLNSSELKSAK